MTQRDNILQELNELQSTLVNAGAENVYQAPYGYFDGLADLVLNRIRALDTDNVSEELNHLSPLLNNISKKMPYSVPAGFFNELAEKIMPVIRNDREGLTATEELKELSPLLSGLKKEMPYDVPQGYFETLGNRGAIGETKPAAKVISITRQKWFRYAAAAVVVGFIAIGGFLIFNKNGNTSADPEAIVNKMMNKVSTEDINNFVKSTDLEAPVVASIDTKSEVKDKNDVQELIKDIPDKDIQNFLDETQSGEPDNGDDVLMN